MVEESKAYTLAMFGVEIHGHIKSLLSAIYMEERMRRVQERRMPIIREEVLLITTEQETLVAIAGAAKRVASFYITQPPLPAPRPPHPAPHQPHLQPCRPLAPAPQPSQRGACYNWRKMGHQKNGSRTQQHQHKEGKQLGGEARRKRAKRKKRRVPTATTQATYTPNSRFASTTTSTTKIAIQQTS